MTISILSSCSRAVTRRRWRVLATAGLLLCAALSCGPASAAEKRTFTDGGGSLEVILPNGIQSSYGYYPMRITAVNTGSKPAVWNLRMTNLYGPSNDNVNPEGTLERIVVPAHQSVERELLMPMGRIFNQGYYHSIQISVISPSGRVNPWGLSSSSNSNDDEKFSPVPTLITESARAALGHENLPSESGMHGQLEVQAASGDWRGYMNYSVVLLTGDDWRLLPPAARNALADWTRMGGQLQFICNDATGLPADAPSPDVPGQTSRGLGGVHAADAILRKKDLSHLDSVKTAKSRPSPANQAQQQRDLLRPWLLNLKLDLVTDRFVVWPTVLVLLVFFVIMTPVNLFLFAPSRRRHRLFFTTPVIALGACLVLAMAVMLADGVGGRGARLVLIESRPGTDNRQYITQWQASRCGALLGTDFVVNDAIHITPLQQPGSTLSVRVQGERVACGGGWFTSRAVQSQQLQAVRPGRGRLEWSSSANGSLQAVSTFDFPLEDVYVRRNDGSWVHAPRMRQGEVTALAPLADNQVKEALNQRLKDIPCAAQIRAMGNRQDHFIAFTDKPPAIATLGVVDWQDSGIVTGNILTP